MNAVIAGWVNVGDVDNARNVFKWMPERNMVRWIWGSPALLDELNLPI